jgi:hypothetical protein
MRKRLAIAIAAIVVVASAGSVIAHHSLARYDTTKPVKVKGVVVLFQRVNPHSMIFIDQKGTNGEVQRWAVEGPAINQLTRKGIEKDFLKVGDVIEACGYVTKDNIERTVNTEPGERASISVSLKAPTPTSVSGRLMDGELLVLPNGKKEVWSDYGFHWCMGPDYHDNHK